MKWKHYIINSTSKLRDTMMGYGNAARPQPLQTVCRQICKGKSQKKCNFLAIEGSEDLSDVEKEFRNSGCRQKMYATTWEIEYEISVALCVSLRTFPLSASQLDGDSPTRSTSSVDHRRTKPSVSSSFRPFSPFKLNLKMGRQPLRRLLYYFYIRGYRRSIIDGGFRRRRYLRP